MKTSTVPGKSWFRIENKADVSASIFLYDEIGSFGTSADDFVKQLRDVKSAAIDVFVNSPGGECYDGLAIFNALRNHRAHVTVHIDGLAASAASFVAMAGDRIVAERNATLMIHNAHAVGVGDADDMRKMADMLDRMTDTIASIYADRAGGTVATWRARMKTETWFSADEAKTAGLVDEVASTPTPKGMPRNTWDLSIFNFAGRSAAPDPFALAEETVEEEVEPPTVVPAREDDPAVEPDPVEALVPTPEPEPLILAAFDPAQFRDAIKAASVLPFDPADFRDAMTGLAHDAPAPPANTHRPVDLGPLPEAEPEVAPANPWNVVHDHVHGLAHEAPAPPTIQPTPVDLGPLPQPAEPIPEPPPLNPWDQLRAAVRIAANNAPAPPQPNSTTTESPAEEPGFSMDAPAFRTALRRAKL
jgi:ATP-dependent Clp endopeptidase proteolytic subunit ClpP